jgi:hypothetical protein
MGCVARATRSLEGTAGVEQVTFLRESEQFRVTVTPRFRLREAASHVQRAGELHDRQNGVRRGPPWVLRLAGTASIHTRVP